MGKVHWTQHTHLFKKDKHECSSCGAMYDKPYGGKQYYYQTEDKIIHISATVIVPVGKGNEQKKVRVVNMTLDREYDFSSEQLHIHV